MHTSVGVVMNIPLLDNRLIEIKEKIFSGRRLDFEDGLALYKSPDLIGIGFLADYMRRRRHGDKAYYVYNQHLNYTNVCINHCLFCAFSRKKGETGSYTFSIEDVKKRLLERIDEPVRELHVVGGLNPSIPFEFYVDMIKTIREIRPEATVKAFTAVEIDFLSKMANLSL
ncbi:MAG: aminofutalosine synthase MqnE, partial [Deltaproteobacteria bacterium]|nr:aminofutalosine synthase MqnE [Deltaproteobacteria bacterium]